MFNQIVVYVMNFLEELVAEWYDYRGFFVKTNIHTKKLSTGGYEGEIDVIAYDSNKKELFHIETSSDAKSWNDRKEIFQKKFNLKSEDYKKLLDLEINSIQKIVLVSYNQPNTDIDFEDGIQLKTIPTLMLEIINDLKSLDPMKKIVNEKYPILRAIQLSSWYFNNRQK